jgi:hypothetical protein
MGGSKSQTVKQFFNMEATNKNITNQITTNAVKVGASQTSINKLKIVIRGSVIGCDIKTNQKIDAKLQSTVEAATSEILDMKTEIQNSMQQAASSNMEMLTELGSLSDVIGKSDQNIEQNINTIVENVIETNITTENITELMTEQVNINNQELIIGGNYDCRGGRGTIDLQQDITAQLSASAVTNMITEKLLENKMVNDLAAEATASVKQENTGFAGIIDSIGGAVSSVIGAWGNIVGMVACLLCVLCIGLLAFALSPAGQQATTNASGAAAKRYGG